MIKEILLCIGTFFCVIGIISSVKCICTQICRKSRHTPKITLGVNNGSDSVEVMVRQLIKSCPNSEILILDSGSEEEAKEIIHKLCKDFGCVKYMGLLR